VSVSSGGEIWLTSSEPVVVPDEEHGFVLKHTYSPASDDKLDIQVNALGLLTQVKLVSDGQVDETLVNATKSASVFLETALGNNEIIFQEFVDPAVVVRNDTARADLSQRLTSALRRAAGHTRATAEAREAALQLAPVTVDLKRLSQPPAQPVGSLSRAPDCGLGFCYRRNVTYILALRFANGHQQSKLFQAPNDSATYVMPIERGAFTTWTTDITLRDGILTTYKKEHGAEFAEAVLLPFELVGAAIEGITQRGSLFTSQASRLEAELKWAEARKAAREAEHEAEAALRVNPMLTVVVGRTTGTSAVDDGFTNPDRFQPDGGSS
jgi:hypothetical protein